jgi:hypothetical protein
MGQTLSSVKDWFETNKTALITGTVVIAAIGIGYMFFKPKDLTAVPAGPEPPGILAKGGSFLTVAVTVAVLAIGAYFIYSYVSGEAASSGTVASTPVTPEKPKKVSSAQTPPSSGTDGGKYGILYWMYIQDWNYKFGQTKPVILRESSTGQPADVNPSISLHPTENSLQVTVSMFPSSTSGSTGSSEPAPSSNDGSATDSTYTCTVPDVPLQTWFCVGVSLDSRNLDVYLNGKLVRSCVLPAVPKPVTGDLQIMPNGGFSGKVIDVYHYSRSLVPSDVSSFCAKGTNGTKYTQDKLPSKGLFGYKVDVGVFNQSGQEVKKFVL